MGNMMSKKKKRIVELRYGNWRICVPEMDISEFLYENFDFEEHIKPAFESNIESDHTDQCDSCDDVCDDDCCSKSTLDAAHKEIDRLRGEDLSSAHNMVHEYFKLNTLYPLELIKALGREEVLKLLELAER